MAGAGSASGTADAGGGGGDGGGVKAAVAHGGMGSRFSATQPSEASTCDATRKRGKQIRARRVAEGHGAQSDTAAQRLLSLPRLQARAALLAALPS